MAEAIIKKRLMEREKVLEKARLFAQYVREKIDSGITVVLFSSYARGDFGKGSDVDLLIVTDSHLPLELHRGIDLIIECIRRFPEVEPVLLTIREVEDRYRINNSLIVEAAHQSIYLLDELGLEKKISLQARRRG